MKIFGNKNSTIDEIKKQCQETHQVQGEFEGHRWSLKLGYCERRGDAIKVIEESVCRFTQSQPCVTLWDSQKDLSEYERKRSINHNYTRVQREKLWKQFEDEESDRLHKRKDMGLIDSDHDKKNARITAESRIEMRILNSLPYSPSELASSHLACIDFNLGHFQTLIQTREKELLAKHGNLPSNPSIIPFWITSGHQPILVVSWNCDR